MESPLIWLVTIAGIAAFFVFDFLVVVRKPHEPGFRESVRWTIFYVSLACVFGFSMWGWAGAEKATEFFAGYVTEWSLSVDNLFVFLVILTRFAVPAVYRQRALLVGVALALVLRGIFIAVGAAALSAFSWVFYIFGIFLLWTAISVGREGGAEQGDIEYKENRAMRAVRRVLPATDDYRGVAVIVRERGRRMMTPMLLVMIAIGSTDVLFALDSIPAIFGLTRDPYVVFTANAFALMGLRQLFFVVDGLLRRLIYLSYGLAFVLAFIGVKLVSEALRENTLGFINGGHPVESIPEIATWLSLVVILGAILVAGLFSVVATRRAVMSGEAADFYTGIVSDLYEPLRTEVADPARYARFIEGSGEPALELGCGGGDPIVELRVRGFDVEGVDASAAMLARCRGRAAAAGVDVVLHRQRMEDLNLPRTYRSIFLAGPTFTVVADDAAALSVLKRIRAHLAPGGTVLVPLFIPERTPPHRLGVRREAVGESGERVSVAVVTEHYDSKARTRTAVLRYERDTADVTEIEDREWLLHWHTRDGFRSLAARAGLEAVAVIGDDGEPAAPDADEFTFVLRATDIDRPTGTPAERAPRRA